MRKGRAASRLRPRLPVRGPGSRRRARWQRQWRRRWRLLCASRWRRRYGAEPSAGGLFRPGQHAHRHGRRESEGHVGGNVLSPASLRRAPRPARSPLGPLALPRLPLARRGPSPRRPRVPAAPRGGRGRLRADGARGARAPGRVSLNCHEGRVAAAASGRRAERLPRRAAAARGAPGFLSGRVWSCRDARAPSAPGLAAGVWAPGPVCAGPWSLSASLRCPGVECDPQHVYFHEVLLRSGTLRFPYRLMLFQPFPVPFKTRSHPCLRFSAFSFKGNKRRITISEKPTLRT